MFNFWDKLFKKKDIAIQQPSIQTSTIEIKENIVKTIKYNNFDIGNCSDDFSSKFHYVNIIEEYSGKLVIQYDIYDMLTEEIKYEFNELNSQDLEYRKYLKKQIFHNVNDVLESDYCLDLVGSYSYVFSNKENIELNGMNYLIKVRNVI